MKKKHNQSSKAEPGLYCASIRKRLQEKHAESVLRDVDIEKLLAAINKFPDVREAKIREIKQRLHTGSYSIDSRAIVEKMLQDL
jgi:flagellar biosynthesis anti-sigma factor FlgM